MKDLLILPILLLFFLNNLFSIFSGVLEIKLLLLLLLMNELFLNKPPLTKSFLLFDLKLFEYLVLVMC